MAAIAPFDAAVSACVQMQLFRRAKVESRRDDVHAHGCMRVLVVGETSFDCAASSCSSALKAMGHEVMPFDYRKSFAPWPFGRDHRLHRLYSVAMRGIVREDRHYLQKQLLDASAQFCPDWILVLTINAVLPQTVQRWRAQGSVVTGWFQDAMVNFGRGDFFNADYDALYLKDRWVVDRLQTTLGDSRYRLLPQACDPALHRPLPLSAEQRAKYQCDVALFGNSYHFRTKQLGAFIDDFDLRIYGTRQGWEEETIRKIHAGYSVRGDDKCRAMLAAKVALNPQHYSEIGGINKRTFELAGIGAFQITNNPVVRDYFPDSEIVLAVTPNDVRQAIHHYLERPEERQAMGERAHNHAHAKHTYQHRMEAIIADHPALARKAGIAITSE